jgi:hypothetical protein
VEDHTSVVDDVVASASTLKPQEGR